MSEEERYHRRFARLERLDDAHQVTIYESWMERSIENFTIDPQGPWMSFASLLILGVSIFNDTIILLSLCPVCTPS